MGLLDGKVAVITGAGSGMGRASCKVFVREGAKVVAADISGAEKDTAAALGASVLPVHCDVTQEADVEAMVRAAVEEFGRVDAVLNVAGIAGAAMLADVTTEHYDRFMDVDLRGVFLGTKHGIRAMLANGNGGAIVNWSSLAGLNAAPVTSVYSAAKAGVISFTKAAAVEYGEQGDPRQLPLPRLHPHRDERGRRREAWPRACSRRRRWTAAASRKRSPRSRPSSRRTAPPTSAAPSSRSTAGGPRSSPERRRQTNPTIGRVVSTGEARAVRVPRP